MKKYAMIVDGHNFMFKTLCVLPLSKRGLWLDEKKDREMFSLKLMQNFLSSLRDFKNIVNNVIFTLDSSSWRKTIGEVEYKGTRHMEEKINWEGFRDCVNGFCREITKYNVIVSKVKQAEADDLIFYWARRLKIEDIPVIINSSDKDMLQLVRNNDGTNCECLLYSTTTKKLYTPFGYMETNTKEKTIDDFLAPGGSLAIYERYDAINDLIKKKKFELEEVDANKELFCKILSGDKSDNIPSVYTVVKNNKTYGITELKAGQITNMFLEKTGTTLTPELLYVESALITLCECIQNVMKTDTDINELLKNLKRNIKYIHLSKNNIPENVVFDMMKSVDSINYKDNKLNMNGLLSTQTKTIDMNIGVLKDVDGEDFSFIKNKKVLF